MNQILSVEMKKEKGKSHSSGPIEIKKIIIFFCVILLLFGLVIAGKAIYTVVSNGGISTTKNNNTPNVTTTKQGNMITITITHNIEISKIVYNWNNGENKEIQGNGSNYMEETLELPVGNNVLNIIVIDAKGNQKTFTKEFVADPSEPQISLELVGTKIKIIAKDNEKLSLITYRWDEEEEKQIVIPEDSSAQVEEEITIPAGQHTLTVVVVNAQNKQITKTQEVKGVVKPKVTIERDTEDPTYVILTATDEISLMKEMRFWVNGKGYKVVETQEDGKKIQWKFKVEQGENLIKLTGINNDDIEDTVEVRYTL